MPQAKRFEGRFTDAQDARFAIICSRFNDFVVRPLENAAVDTLTRHGVAIENIHVYSAPGAHELPILAQRCAQSGAYDAIIALGAVIRGATGHYDVVVNEQAKGLGAVALKYDLPVLTGVLTTETIEQAIERAGTKAGNKGHDVAMAALEMVSLLRQIPRPA